ncbi:MAG: glycosyltransferase [Opitutaceae bacterium]|nr:glycosyltransferase [Opitutaceae bacterium]
MKRVLIVSPHFPPTNAPDMQRIRMSLPYFRDFGWAPTILTVKSSCVEAPCDPLLAETVPLDIAIHRVAALPGRWTRLVGLGTLGYRAWFQLAVAGARLIREQPPDLVYFSTTQFLVTALGRRWRTRFGTPFVIDVQDPWRTDYYKRPGAPRPPGGWKYRFAHWQAKRLEEPSWRDAAGFISVSEHYLAQLRARYPWFAKKPAATIPFGVSAADLELARRNESLIPAFVRVPGAVHLVSVGAAGPIMQAALERLFAGVRSLLSSAPEVAARIRFHFIGTSYAPPERATPTVEPLARACGVGALVREQPGRVGYFTALKTMLAADAIVIPGSDDPAYNPSKLATCALVGKPVLALHATGSAFGNLAHQFGFATPAEPASVADFLKSLAAGPTPPPSFPMESGPVAGDFSARACTQQQCELLSRALAASGT